MMGMGGMGGFNPAAVQLRKTGSSAGPRGGATHPSPPAAQKPPQNKYGTARGLIQSAVAPPKTSSYGGGARGGASSSDDSAALNDEIQKLKARIDELERENAELRQENEELKSRGAGGGMGGGPAKMAPKAPAAGGYGAPAAGGYGAPAAGGYGAPAKKPAAPPPMRAGGGPGEQYRALYNFDGEQDGDLTFRKGEIIYVQKKEGSWWEGTCNGKSGAFPSNYVAKV